MCKVGINANALKLDVGVKTSKSQKKYKEANKEMKKPVDEVKTKFFDGLYQIFI